MCPLRKMRIPTRKIICPFSLKTQRRLSITSATQPRIRPVTICLAIGVPGLVSRPRMTKQREANPFNTTAGTYIAIADNCRILVFDSFKVVVVNRLDQNNAGVWISKFKSFHYQRSFISGSSILPFKGRISSYSTILHKNGVECKQSIRQFPQTGSSQVRIILLLNSS